MKNSIQYKLVLWISVAILAISALASMISFWLAYNAAQQFQDDTLRQVALLAGTSKTPLEEEQIIETKDSGLRRIVVQPAIVSPGALPPLLKLPEKLPPGYHTVEIDGLGWRVYVHTVMSGHQLAVAQEVRWRKVVARESALLTLLPLLVVIPLLIIVTRQIIKVEMSSLRALAKLIDTQDEENLSLLPTDKLPTEATPFMQAINRLLERVKHMNETQRRFIADAAHELRSPLTALSLQAQNIERTNSFAISKERLIPLKDGLERSRRLLNQLLDLVRQQSTEAITLRVDVAAVALVVIEEIMPIADAKKIDLGLAQEAAVQIDADPSAIRLLLRNAVDNALRYSPEGGEVTVRIGREDNNAVVEVIDNGPGIPEAELERVFDAFYRLPNNTQAGSGLGLAIARSIAVQFKGSVSLRNRCNGTGLIFTYRQRESQKSSC